MDNEVIRNVVLGVVPAEDEDGCGAKFVWDSGERQRVLHFQCKQDADAGDRKPGGSEQ
jgi:hypothetical protein